MKNTDLIAVKLQCLNYALQASGQVCNGTNGIVMTKEKILELANEMYDFVCDVSKKSE